jgi:hypothetical protein
VYSKLTDKRHFTGIHKHGQSAEQAGAVEAPAGADEVGLKQADPAEVQRQQNYADRLAAPKQTPAGPRNEVAEEADTAPNSVEPRIAPSDYVQHREEQAQRLQQKSAAGAERLRAHRQRKAQAEQTQAGAQAFGHSVAQQLPATSGAVVAAVGEDWQAAAVAAAAAAAGGESSSSVPAQQRPSGKRSVFNPPASWQVVAS